MKIKPEIEKKIDELLSKMTVREKLGQLTQYHSNGDLTPSIEERLRKGELGGFLADGGTLDDWEKAKVLRDRLNYLQKIAVEESRLGIPAIFGRDVIHGHKVPFPDGIAMACSFNPELVQKCYAAIAEEASNDGMNWTFSPMVDLSRDPRWGRCVEGYGEDPYLAGKMAAAAVKGFQGDTTENLKAKNHIAACAKHYIGYGGAEGGRDYQKAEISDYTLRNFYLNSFKRAVEAGCLTVMSSFNEISGQPVTSSHYLLTEVLRDELGFNGYVVSDDWSVKQLVNQAVAENYVDAASMAMTAGVDMDMDDFIYIDYGEEAIKKGLLSEETLNEAVRRILRVKFEIGLFDDPYCHENGYDIEEHSLLAREIAEESVVLLKNNGILPLKKTGKLNVYGNFFDNAWDISGAWSCDLAPSRVHSVSEGISNVAPDLDVAYATGPDPDDPESDIALFVIGEELRFEGEASSRQHLEIDEELLSDVFFARTMGKMTVGVFLYGRPMALKGVESLFDAIIWGMHCGGETGNAIAEILFGDVNPSGKLSMTLLKTTGQVPLYYNSPKSCRFVDEYYGRVNNLENYRDGSGEPAYPFGYGLSYTDFEITPPTADKEKVSLEALCAGEKFVIRTKLKNIGNFKGKQTVQCYVRDEFASCCRPLRELKGFEKCELMPGEEKEIVFTLGLDELGFYHFDKRFYAEKGTFRVYVGDNCRTDSFVTVELV